MRAAILAPPPLIAWLGVLLRRLTPRGVLRRRRVSEPRVRPQRGATRSGTWCRRAWNCQRSPKSYSQENRYPALGASSLSVVGLAHWPPSTVAWGRARRHRCSSSVNATAAHRMLISSSRLTYTLSTISREQQRRPAKSSRITRAASHCARSSATTPRSTAGSRASPQAPGGGSSASAPVTGMEALRQPAISPRTPGTIRQAVACGTLPGRPDRQPAASSALVRLPTRAGSRGREPACPASPSPRRLAGGRDHQPTATSAALTVRLLHVRCSWRRARSHASQRHAPYGPAGSTARRNPCTQRGSAACAHAPWTHPGQTATRAPSSARHPAARRSPSTTAPPHAAARRPRTLCARSRRGRAGNPKSANGSEPTTPGSLTTRPNRTPARRTNRPRRGPATPQNALMWRRQRRPADRLACSGEAYRVRYCRTLLYGESVQLSGACRSGPLDRPP